MVDKKTINNFEKISNVYNFSKYNSILDREFKEKSLKNFIESLKHYRKKEKPNFLYELYKKFPYQFEEKKIIEEEDIKFGNMDNQNSKENDEEPKVNEEKDNKEKKFKKNCCENDGPNFLKYNPNYDSIYKKIPCFKIGKGFNKKENMKKMKSIKNKLIKETKIENVKANKKNDENALFKTNIKINSEKSKTISIDKKQLALPQIFCRDNNNYSKNEDIKNNNHETIISKKNNKYSKNNIKLEAIDNYWNFKNIVDFKKMSSRNDKFLLNQYTLETPSSDKYTPKYTFVEDKIHNVNFSPFGLNKNAKKFKLYKMMRSYHTPTEYQIIDNSKLSNDKDFINQQLAFIYNINPRK